MCSNRILINQSICNILSSGCLQVRHKIEPPWNYFYIFISGGKLLKNMFSDINNFDLEKWILLNVCKYIVETERSVFEVFDLQWFVLENHDKEIRVFENPFLTEISWYLIVGDASVSRVLNIQIRNRVARNEINLHKNSLKLKFCVI